jgi:hypothetical protein
MAGKKSITLLNRQGNPINNRYRYKKLRSALRKAVGLSVSHFTTVQVWDLERGKEVALVSRYKNDVRINIPHPRIFDNLWSDA